MNKLFSLFLLAVFISFSPSVFAADDIDESAIQRDINQGGTIETAPTDQFIAEEQNTFGVNPDAEAMLQTNLVTVLSPSDEKLVLEAAEALKNKRPDLSQKLKTIAGE